ncbi:MAG TPA: SHOCT domain-containing protein [Ilumatobacteraceae bacterium]|nr:SHOCT domain-containing protein [Ilumatobacteraceae bacterium]
MTVLIIFVVFRSVAKAGGGMRAALGMGPSADKQQEIARLQATGTKARAHILGAQPTGLVVNNINIGIDLHVMLEPLDGSPRFQASKRMVVSQVNLPRVGDVWPAWFDPADHTKFALAMVTQFTPEVAALFAQFGIANPLGGATAFPGGMAGAAPAGYPGAPQQAGFAAPAMGMPSPGAMNPAVELERLATLHAQGALSSAEFEQAKRRLLG